jgi:2-keto-4-pentenoate hydratase/2-oxohepta-3-ene-1,7-dioic acid hydratase in catechol pathway
MILVSYHTTDGTRVGVQTPNGLVETDSPLKAILAGQATVRRGAPLETVRIAPAVPDPGKIICVGLNYRGHAAEIGAPMPTSPILFGKFANALAADGDDISLDATAEQYDWEAELAVVIGQGGRNISESTALEHVWGYCCANDLSARDLQMKTSQWLLGKTLDRFLPLGPKLVSADEIGDPAALGIRCFVNDEIVQESTVGDMVFSVEELVSYISRYFPLEPGDVISTGTPAGVAMGRPNTPWLRPGDVVRVEIDNLGSLTNRMVMGVP